MRQDPTLFLFVLAATGFISCARGFTIVYLQDLQPRGDSYIDDGKFRAVMAAMRYQIKQTGANITLRGHAPTSQTQCSKNQYQMNVAYKTDQQRATVTSSSFQTLRLMPLLEGSFGAFFAQGLELNDRTKVIGETWVRVTCCARAVLSR